MIAASLFGLTVLTAVVSFAVGVAVAYSIWGMRASAVDEAQSSIVLLRRKLGGLKEQQAKLEARRREL